MVKEGQVTNQAAVFVVSSLEGKKTSRLDVCGRGSSDEIGSVGRFEDADGVGSAFGRQQVGDVDGHAHYARLAAAGHHRRRVGGAADEIRPVPAMQHTTHTHTHKHTHTHT